MKKYYAALVIVAAFMTQQSFADSSAASSDSDEPSFKQCENIASACLSAGFERTGGTGKAFWHDCMKPVLLGKTVSGVTVDSKDVSDCRKFKIEKMQKEIKELEHATSSH